tara:strand:- start:617 stop:1057 length:441 start_codon:yes stop_codon:yes gene_type:complete
MANKYLNVLVGGVNTPVNIDDVVAVAATGNAGNVATTAVLTYKNSSTLTLTTPADDNGFAVATAPDVVRSLWEAIIAANALPWNMVMYPGTSEAFGWTVQPATSQDSEYAKQSAVPVAPGTFEAKQSSSVLAKDGGAIVWSTVTIA